jgi:hypothetical protein
MKISDVSYLPPEIARTLLPPTPGYARPPFCLDDDEECELIRPGLAICKTCGQVFEWTR